MVTPWLVEHGSTLPPRARLVAVPYAGAGTAAFAAWRLLVPDDVAFSVVRLPGRESRYVEPPVTDVRIVVDALMPLLASDDAPPLVVFGYSLGALIAYELAVRLHSCGRPPVLLAVGGADAPHVPRTGPRLSALDDQAFVTALRDLGGTPPEVFDSPELMSIVLPALRADFAMLDSYRPAACDAGLDAPITTYSGRDDREVTEEGVARWAELTTGPTTHHTYEGGHFFLAAAAAHLVTTLANDVDDVLAPRHV